MLYLRIRQSVAQPYHRCPSLPCGILDTPTDEESSAVHATHILFASAASVLLHLPSPYLPKSFIHLAAHLPEGLRLFASYVMAHALYLRGEYGRSLGMAENA